MSGVRMRPQYKRAVCVLLLSGRVLGRSAEDSMTRDFNRHGRYYVCGHK